MDYSIKHVTTERELDDALAFEQKVFGVSSERNSPAYSREKWLQRMGDYSDLLLYAQSGGEVVGIVFGRVESNGSITVGPVAMDERFRKRGIARQMMLLLERRALEHGIRHLGLGARESAEGFYEKLGYTGSLLVQSERHSIAELLSMNTKYRVIKTNVYDGTVNQIFLELPVADREFQRHCERTLPGCGTQMVYGKTITAEENMKENIGNYAKHAQYWDWSNLDHDRTAEHDYWYRYAKRYGDNVLIPMCALGETGAYMASRGMNVTAFDITPQMIAEGKKRFGDVPGLRLYAGDVTDFRFDIPPVDFCYSMDFGHLLTIEDVKKALACINNHLRDGGGLVIETTLPPTQSYSYPLRTFEPVHQVYPGLKVWKTGEGRYDAETGRHYIVQKFFTEDESGRIESFDHAFYLQSYSREQWLSAFAQCGFEVVGEYNNREVDSWQSSGEGFHIFEARRTKMKFTQEQIEFAASQIGLIDSGERGIFLDTVNTEKQNEAHIFHNEGMAGVFYSCMIFSGLRMHISFVTDTDQCNEELAACVQAALDKSGMASCVIWIRNEDRRIIKFLKEKFHVTSEGAHDYASIEFIMRRESFGRTVDESELEIRPYEEKHIDDYLTMLDGSMTFVDPSPNFFGAKQHYFQYLNDRAKNNSFEAFWKGDGLVGLYWRKNAEIDILAVAKEHQRKGYGSIILTRAIDMVFKNTDADFAYLYAVDWNVQGQSFYQKYGMEQNGHSYLLKLNNEAGI